MGDVLVAMLVTLVVMVAAVALTLAYGVRRLRRHNQVSRRYRTRAPLHWLVSPGQCARLHRRLRDSVSVLHSTVPARSKRQAASSDGPARLAGAADELEAHAAALDGDLLVAARLRGPAGSQLRSRLRTQVGEVERFTARLAAAATAASPARPAARPSRQALDELDEQLDALEAARDELARLEAGVGLSLPEPEPLVTVPRAATPSHPLGPGTR